MDSSTSIQERYEWFKLGVVVYDFSFTSFCGKVDDGIVNMRSVSAYVLYMEFVDGIREGD